MATKTVCACNMLAEGEYEVSADEASYRQIGMETWLDHTEECISGEDVASTLDEWLITSPRERAFPCKYGHTHGSLGMVEHCETAEWN